MEGICPWTLSAFVSQEHAPRFPLPSFAFARYCSMTGRAPGGIKQMSLEYIDSKVD